MSEQSIRDQIEETKRTLEKERKEQALKESRERFDAKITQLADLAVEYSQERGEEDPITQLLVAFLEVAMEMKDMMKTAEAVTVAMQCVGEAISFLDDANIMSNEMLEQTTTHKYNWWTRMKQRRLHRRAIRNHRNRMREFAGGLNAKLDMAQEMVKSMKKFAVDLQKSFGKKKKGKSGESAGISARTAAFLQERAQLRNATINTDAMGGKPAAASADEGDYGGVFHDN